MLSLFEKSVGRVISGVSSVFNTSPDSRENSSDASPRPFTPRNCNGVGQGVALNLRFHPVHGKAIKISDDSRTAVRDRSFFEHGVVFSHRPIAVNECVAVEVVEMAAEFNGPLRIGFTSIHPQMFGGQRPDSGQVPLGRDLKNCPGVWIKSVHLFPIQVGTTIYWKLTNNGSILYGVDGKNGGIFIREADPSLPMWAVVDAYGSVKSVKFVNKTMVLTKGSQMEECDVSVYESPNLRKSPALSRSINRGPNPLSFRRKVTLAPLQDFNKITIPSSLSVASASPLATPFLSPRTFDEALTGLCILCTDEMKNAAFIKCGHMCMCYECAESFRNQRMPKSKRPLCPICRGPITSVLKVYQ